MKITSINANVVAIMGVTKSMVWSATILFVYVPGVSHTRHKLEACQIAQAHRFVERLRNAPNARFVYNVLDNLSLSEIAQGNRIKPGNYLPHLFLGDLATPQSRWP